MTKHLSKAGYKNVQMGSNPGPKKSVPPAPVKTSGGKVPSVSSKFC